MKNQKQLLVEEIKLTKQCTKCGDIKNISEFNKDKTRNDGVSCWCKTCQKIYWKKYYARPEVVEHRREYLENYYSIPKNKKRRKKWEQKHWKEICTKPEVKEQRKKYKEEYEARPEIKEHKKEYDKEYNANPEVKEHKKKYERNRRKADINFKLRKLYRSRVLNAVKSQGVKKAGHSLDLLGCSIQDFLQYLQLTALANNYDDFDIGNYDGKEYNIHHIKFCSKFDLSDPTQQFECFNYKNQEILSLEDHLLVHKGKIED